jgi:hypothetical protein
MNLIAGGPVRQCRSGVLEYDIEATMAFLFHLWAC